MQPLIIADVQYREFQKPFIRPFHFANQVLTQRSGYYIDLSAQDGARGMGEIAPLPGLSLETLKKAKHDLETILPLLKGPEVPKEIIQCCSSVRFGVESAFLSLSAACQHSTLQKIMNARDEVASAVLLQGTQEQIKQEAKEFKAQGHNVFKLKVGSRNIPLDVKNVQDLRLVIGADSLIRLDANRSWQLKEAVLFAQLIGNAQIEFIEEPVNDVRQIEEFYQITGMPVALDESLWVMRPGINAPGRCSPALVHQESVHAYVIKPMLAGGVTVALDWIGQAKANGKKAIISSSFETDVGMVMLKALANLTGQVSGLGTGRWVQ